MENLIRLPQKGSKSTEAALQMWRMESSLRLDEARFIGVGNPENVYNCTRFVKHWSKEAQICESAQNIVLSFPQS